LTGFFHLMSISHILFDSEVRFRLLPFTHTRPVADIRCGIFTMRERWEYYFEAKTSTLTEIYLEKLFPLNAGKDNLLINAAVFATKELTNAVQQLKNGQKLVKGDMLLAGRINTGFSYNDIGSYTTNLQRIEYPGDVQKLENPWDIFSHNDIAIREDFKAIAAGRKSAAIPEGTTIMAKDDIFIEEGAKIFPGTVINAHTGPVYIGKDAEVMEGVMIRGPLALGEHAVLKMGAKVYGATTIGPGSKVGGEVSNVVFFANSNKAHDGFLGNAVIGEWCNLGADSNCSNLKNNYDGVKVWDEHAGKSVNTGLTFCGLMMGDHSKCGINTMFNTGTIAGVSCNIYGGGFPEKFIPSFAWGGSDDITTYSFDRAMETAARVMARRNKQLGSDEKDMLRHIFEKTTKQRELLNIKSK
jgi:UDP-N-acetylglucosamine diphosphorylase/glucosamine-1-phosphate N-acetyltransferase